MKPVDLPLHTFSRMLTIASVFFVAVAVGACAKPKESDGVEVVSYKTLLSRNLVNLNKLSVGMVKGQVTALMGTFVARTKDMMIPNPYQTEPFTVGKTQYEVMYYLTRKYPPFTPIKLSQATPVVLREGRVIGWSHTTLSAAKDGRLEVQFSGR